MQPDFPYISLLTDGKVSILQKAFANNSSVDVKLSKTQLSKIMLLGRFLDRLLGALIKVGLPLMKNALASLVKSILTILGWKAVVSSEFMK